MPRSIFQVGQVMFKEAAGGKDSKALLKEQEALLKKELAQFRSKVSDSLILKSTR